MGHTGSEDITEESSLAMEVAVRGSAVARKPAISMTKEEEAYLNELLSPVKSKVAELHESPSDSYSKLKAKLKATLAQCDSLVSSTRSDVRGMQHIEEEFQWWGERIHSIEEGHAMAQEDGPTWEDLYTTVCRPGTAVAT